MSNLKKSLSTKSFDIKIIKIIKLLLDEKHPFYDELKFQVALALLKFDMNIGPQNTVSHWSSSYNQLVTVRTRLELSHWPLVLFATRILASTIQERDGHRESLSFPDYLDSTVSLIIGAPSKPQRQ